MGAESSKATPRSNRTLMLAVGASLALGVLLRLAWYLGNRCLWFDEAALAISIVSRSFGGLLDRLAYDQIAPPGFLWLERLAVMGFGNTEIALRLVPLLAGLSAVAAVGLLARKALGDPWGFAAASMAALSWPLIYYSAEAKQYGVEALVAITILLLALGEVRGSRPGRPLWILMAFGVTAMWLSYSAVFVLPSFVAAVALRPDLGGRRRRWVRGAILAAVWAAWFGALYLLLIQRSAVTPSIQTFWREQFLGQASVGALPSLLLGPFGEALGFGLATPVAAALAVLGALSLLHRRASEGALVVLPFLAVGAASVLNLYPIGGRVLLFLAPAAFILIAAGLRTIAALPWRTTRAAAMVGAVLLVADLGARSVPPRDPRPIPDLRRDIVAIKRCARPNDLIYLGYWTSRPFTYYASRYGFVPARMLCGLPSDDPGTFLGPLMTIHGEPRAWVLVAPSPFVAGDMTAQLAVLNRVARCRVVSAAETSTVCLCSFPAIRR